MDFITNKIIASNREFRVWNIEEANTYVAKITPHLSRCGLKFVKIIGSVAKQGWSYHDLDILVDQIDPNIDPDIELLEKLVNGSYETVIDEVNERDYFIVEAQDEKQRVIDIFFEEPMENQNENSKDF